ncbi:M15 family metallopeptidase [Paramicrobacterium chengjingii]|uniref:M15 family metallopeptidase n=1 Tax=Paramicrobacterium chengjingii TaxID=2769067 RepID=UPI00141EB72A|nr:M15 family metallopeptidase [Microbacterium chengjingii]
MARFANGRIPESMLKWFTSGGEKFRSTPATIARWNALVADVRAHEGVTLTITSGPNAYRDYASQVAMRNKHGLGAATPGTSSHGGFWEGRDTMAIDVNNWAVLGQSKFYAYARKHGFSPGLISTTRGYARTETWHLVDLAPWTMPAGTSGSTSKPQTNTASAEEEEDDMPKNSGFVWKNGSKQMNVVVNFGSGAFHEYEAKGAYNNPVAASLDVPADYAPISKSHRDRLEDDMRLIRQGK